MGEELQAKEVGEVLSASRSVGDLGRGCLNFRNHVTPSKRVSEE